MELIITEKPSVANKIAFILSDGKAIRKVYKSVSYYEFEKDGKKIAVAPAVGHLFTLAEMKRTASYPTFEIEWVPSFTVSKSSYYVRNYVELIEKLSKDADSLVCACDYDIEGTLIGYCIYKYIYKKEKIERMKFSALTPYDIKAAYEEKGEFDYGNAFAGEARHTLDWYYGINLSRALMTAVRRTGGYKIMSIGRVQGPTLEILSQLEYEIQLFKPEPYWEVNVKIRGIVFEHEKERFTVEEEAEKALSNTGKTAVIEKVEKKIHEMYPLPPFDLTSLQIEAYRLFKVSPSRTLELAQALYEKALISYPRTSSQKLPSKLNLPKIIEKLSGIKEYSELAGKLIQNKWFSPMQGKKEDPAHPAIHPTGMTGVKSKEEGQVYDLIVKRFLACFANKAKKELENILANSNNEKYKANGSRILERGWTEFYEPYYTGKDNVLPEFLEGTKEKIEEKNKEKKMTKPPNRYSQASIISELEKRHLGTKATRANVLDTLYDRTYIEGTAIQVTEFGLAVEKVMKKYASEILDEELTRKIEDEMEQIEAGQLDKQLVVEEGKQFLLKVLKRWKENEENIGKELSGSLKVTEAEQILVGKCDKCGKNLKIIKMKFGKQFIGCSGYPECRNAYPLPTGAFVKPTDQLCKHCAHPMVLVIKKRKKYSLCIDPNCPSKVKWREKYEENKRNGSKGKDNSPESGHKPTD